MAHQLIADIGGTNARFAICEKGTTGLENIRIFRCAQFDSITEVIEKYLLEIDISVESVCLAVACPINQGSDLVNMTNNHWKFSKKQLAEQFNIKRLILINDFTAAATATTIIDLDDLFLLSGDLQFDLRKQRCILGPGTGLGVAGIIFHDKKHVVLSTEGGHRSFSPENELEDHILQFLRSETEVVSCETLLSGKGLVNIYRAVGNYRQQPVIHSKAKDISTAASEGEPLANETLQTFFEILGSTAGDLALTFGAKGGVYIGGGIAPKFPEALLKSNFRERFENKLNYRPYLKKIPTAIVMHPYPGLLGAAEHMKTI